jgi:hypothetical protein
MISAISPVELTLSTILPAVLLIVLLILKQLAVASGAGHWRAFGRYLNIALAPLLITFLVTVAIKISLIFQ